MPYFLKIKKGHEPIEFLTLGELAILCGKSKDALKKLTQKGILPDANYRKPRKSRTGEQLEGYRLYSKEFLVPRLVPYIRNNISRGKQITIEQQSEMMTMFQQELDHFSTQ